MTNEEKWDLELIKRLYDEANANLDALEPRNLSSQERRERFEIDITAFVRVLGVKDYQELLIAKGVEDYFLPSEAAKEVVELIVSRNGQTKR